MNNNLNEVIKEYTNEEYSVEQISKGHIHKKWLVTINSKIKCS